MMTTAIIWEQLVETSAVCRTCPTSLTDRTSPFLRFSPSPFLLSLALAAMCLWASPACADTIMDWDDSGPATAWTLYHDWSTTSVSVPATGGNPPPANPGNAWLQVTFDATEVQVPDETWRDIAITTEPSELMAGAWTSDMGIAFDFLQDDVAAGAIQVQWKSTTNANIWGYALDVPAGLDTWTSFTASFANWEDWAYPFSSEEQFLADLGSIDWIGVSILRTGTGAQDYGIDNFALMIPEPEEWAMLAAATLACFLALRKKRQLCESPAMERYHV